MNRELINFLISDCLVYGNIESESGVVSDIHFDKYILQSNPRFLNEVANSIVGLIPKQTELIVGIEMGSVPIATLISNKTILPLSIIRKAPKSYGTKKIIEGAELHNNKIVIIEDVIDSGKTIISAVNCIAKFNPSIILVICILYRGKDIRDLSSKLNLEVISLLDLNDLLFAKNGRGG